MKKSDLKTNRLNPKQEMVPETGIEPVRLLGPQDFKSCASASSATPTSVYSKLAL
jgi:hypothetical protein